ncbi:Uncharacterised protein [Erysipelothrix amsterdamensis]|uniref:Uncharacterized protein n=1 Tax=Erysipelothrix amsterdamensis TaxID=2929157 RepID=A0AAU9VFF0_9FIRM|nr:hypothetical protein [Erysipelothrix rhusiopathiae]MCG4436923.1 hypothetical protein [Erysipelothrix rhusiopathiae]CAH2761034.1 Uncharacterised protein [Erysipelothrix sp. A18Y020d]CAH2761045.1 Uncharacterised protein [Erysipelothrix sp. A18Y020d]
MKSFVLAYGYVLLVMMLFLSMLSFSVFKREYQQKRFQYRNALEILIKEMHPDDKLSTKFMELMNDQDGEIVDLSSHFYPKLLQVIYKTKIRGLDVVFAELMIEEGF